MKAVLDTNILVSRFLVPAGKSAQIVSHWENGAFELLVSQPIISECARVLHYPRIRRKYTYTEEEVEGFLTLLQSQAFMTKPDLSLNVVLDDTDDNRIVECALAGEADYIVTGDNHLLSLQSYRGIQIITPATFLFLLSQGQE
ncbi:MAG: putative toxin-antitoxin system toxin component, PIN family [Chloroflexia bacterium]